MPDWIFHIALPYLIATIFKVKEKRLVVFGSLMLDISSFLFAFNEFTNLFNQLTLVNYLTMTHSILGALLFSIAFAFLTINYWRGFIILFLSGLFHMFLDLFQYGADVRLLWPLSFSKFSFPLFDPTASMMFILSLILFVIAILIEKKEGLELKIRLSKMQWVVVFLLIYVLLSYLSIPKLNQENIYNSGFLKNPEMYEGKEVPLTRAHVIANNEVEVDGMKIKIKNRNDLEVGNIILLKGIYSKEGFEVTYEHEDNNRKVIYSAIGFFIALILIIFNSFRNFFYYLRQSFMKHKV
ncbi:metal-dependent hydrolase [Candidatus Woesearchaeota archaeon]|nr:metal-dependent hydrolase [Candidatus Woesearchaeota archaeon]MBI4154695.1 metal-dependent hydrolase [Candidatus Woesearchaeota archaeon]